MYVRRCLRLKLAVMSSSPALSLNSPPFSGIGRRLLVLLLSALGCVGLAYISLQTLPRRDVSSWPVSQGRVTITRTRTTQVRDPKRGRVAALEAEVLVSYSAAGKTYIRWFKLPARPDPAQDQSSVRSPQLEGTLCTVHWRQDHPFEAFVTEYQEY